MRTKRCAKLTNIWSTDYAGMVSTTISLILHLLNHFVASPPHPPRKQQPKAAHVSNDRNAAAMGGGFAARAPLQRKPEALWRGRNQSRSTGKSPGSVRVARIGGAGTRWSGASPRMVPLQYDYRRRPSRRGRRSNEIRGSCGVQASLSACAACHF